MAFERAWQGLVLAFVLCACGGASNKYPLEQPLWRDPDQRPFTKQSEEYYSPFGWDAANQTIFRPISRFFAFDPAGESLDVNALDEVPDSSWYVNRVGRFRMTPEEMATAPCPEPPIDPEAPITVTGAKPNGANPGFIVKTPDGRHFLLKFDGLLQGERATAADVIGSRIYHAAGYYVPCNQIIYFDRKVLAIKPGATAENSLGEKVPLTMHDIDEVLSKGLRAADGRYRASSSLYLEGKPVGPWTYQGTRDDDPNDVVAHEDRRELRGMRLLAAWLNHFDAREQNTLGTFIALAGGSGYVRHNVLDFGDCLGSIWEPPMLGRRIGSAYYLDFPYVAEDFITLGVIRRPWDKARFGPTGTVLGYYDAERFDPEGWHPGYPNPAFIRMSESDGAWMARIIARFEDAHVRAIVDTARLLQPLVNSELVRILNERRDRILRRYLTRLSPLADPVVRIDAGRGELCVTDLTVAGHIRARGQREYSARAWIGAKLDAAPEPRIRFDKSAVCVSLPSAGGARQYSVVDIIARDRGGKENGPLRAHFYQLAQNEYRLVGLERPDDKAAPSP